MTRRLPLFLLILAVGLFRGSLALANEPGDGKERPGGSVARVFTINDSGREIKVRRGDSFRVELEAPGATGYLWEVEDLDTSRLDLVNKSTRVLLSDGRVGGPIVTVFTFRAVSEGSVTLTIEYYRPWEGRATSERSFSLKVNIL